MWFLGEEGRYRHGDGGGGWGGCGRGCGCGVSWVFFVFFRHGYLGEYDGCKGGDRGGGWCGGVGVGVVEVVCGVRMSAGVDGVGNRGEGVVSSGGNVSMAGGGARWRGCCRFSDGIFRELWEDLPYCLPFMLDIGTVFL